MREKDSVKRKTATICLRTARYCHSRLQYQQQVLTVNEKRDWEFSFLETFKQKLRCSPAFTTLCFG